MGLVVNISGRHVLDTMLTKLKLSPRYGRDEAAGAAGRPGARGSRLCAAQPPGFNPTLQVSDEMMVTTSWTSLETLGTDQAPDHWLVARLRWLGAQGWEQELADGAWLVIPPNPKLVFDTPIHLPGSRPPRA